MSGSGSWQNLLPDEQARQLYAEIYPGGLPAAQAKEKLGRYLDPWETAHIIAVDGGRVSPLGPIMTDNDLAILAEWFSEISTIMSRAVADNTPAYRRLSIDLAGPGSSEQSYVDNIMTIIVCALTLDSQVFSLLRKELMGTYPDRNFAGTFFFWGYGFSGGPARIFGFTTYGWPGPSIHVIRSHGLDREGLKAVLRRRGAIELIQSLALERAENDRRLSVAEPYASGIPGTITKLRETGIVAGVDPLRLSIPVLSSRVMISVGPLFQQVAEKIKQKFLARLDDLDDLISRCSFRRCTRPDIYCMLFHLAYSFAADKLVEGGIIPDFPQRAAGEWGVWIH